MTIIDVNSGIFSLFFLSKKSFPYEFYSNSLSLPSPRELLMLDHGSIFSADCDGAEDAPAPWHGEKALVAD
jgi:hypothetical protein